MKRRYIAREYHILAANAPDDTLFSHREADRAGLVAAGMMDLTAGGILTLEGKKIHVDKELPKDMAFLASLYTYVSEKPRTTDQVINAYMGPSKRMERFAADTAASLADAGEEREGRICRLRDILLEDAAADAVEVSCLRLLNRTGRLYDLFSKEETARAQAGLKKLPVDLDFEQWGKMIDYAVDMSAIMAGLARVGLS